LPADAAEGLFSCVAAVPAANRLLMDNRWDLIVV
jgi:hypothetical protein